MDSSLLHHCKNLVPQSYIKQGEESFIAVSNVMKKLLEHVSTLKQLKGVQTVNQDIWSTSKQM